MKVLPSSVLALKRHLLLADLLYLYSVCFHVAPLIAIAVVWTQLVLAIVKCLSI